MNEYDLNGMVDKLYSMVDYADSNQYNRRLLIQIARWLDALRRIKEAVELDRTTVDTVRHIKQIMYESDLT